MGEYDRLPSEELRKLRQDKYQMVITWYSEQNPAI